MKTVIIPNLTYNQYDIIQKELFLKVPWGIVNNTFLTYEKFPEESLSEDRTEVTFGSHSVESVAAEIGTKYADPLKLYTMSVFLFWDLAYVPDSLKNWIVGPQDVKTLDIPDIWFFELEDSLGHDHISFFMRKAKEDTEEKPEVYRRA